MRAPEAPDPPARGQGKRQCPSTKPSARCRNGSVTTFRIVSAVERLYNRLVAWRKARLTETVLRGLSDAQLADIGLHRGEIPEVAGTLAGR